MTAIPPTVAALIADLDFVEKLHGTYDADSASGYYEAFGRVVAFARTSLESAYSSPVSLPTVEEVDAALAIAFQQADDESHENLCFCRDWPESCVTYGTNRPWSHDAESVARATVAALFFRGAGEEG